MEYVFLLFKITLRIKSNYLSIEKIAVEGDVKTEFQITVSELIITTYD